MSAAVLYVKDLENMRGFYEQCCGMLSVEPQGGDFCVLTARGGELMLVRVGESIADALEVADPPRRREETPIKLVFDVGDLEAAERAVLAAGGQVDLTRPAWNFQGRRHRDICDPEGNVTQLRQRWPQ